MLILWGLYHWNHPFFHLTPIHKSHSNVYMAHTPSALASTFPNLLISFASTLAIYSSGHIPEEFIFWNPSFYLIFWWWCNAGEGGHYSSINLNSLPPSAFPSSSQRLQCFESCYVQVTLESVFPPPGLTIPYFLIISPPGLSTTSYSQYPTQDPLNIYSTLRLLVTAKGKLTSFKCSYWY